MKRQNWLLAAIVPLLTFNVFRTVEFVHQRMDAAPAAAAESAAYTTDSLIPKAPARTPSDSFAPTMAQPSSAQEPIETRLTFAAKETADMLTVIVNKEHPLPDHYEPADLTAPDIPFIFNGNHEKRLLREEAARAVEELFAAAKKEGIQLYGVSGYRSYETQKSLYAFNVNRQGLEHASRYSAEPGTSEHQTGLAFDVTSKSADYELDEKFADTPEGQWLAEHAHEYGFVIRYPLGKESVTGYAYEPWHIRYVGRDTAGAAYEYGLTLEELATEAIPSVSP